MADDPYKTLGVARDATEPQIRKAYLKLAKTTHPDLNPGDAKAEERFKAINVAHDLLQDADQRARYDRGDIDGAGQPRPPPGPPPGSRRYRNHTEGAAGARYSAGTGTDDDLGDILSGLFGERAGGQASTPGRPAARTAAIPLPCRSWMRSAAAPSAYLCRTAAAWMSASRQGWTAARCCACAARGHPARRLAMR